MQAGLICEYIAARWGQAGLERVLKEYGAGKETREALQGALKISASQFDEDFAGYVQGQLGSVVSQFEPWQEAQQEAQAAYAEEDWKTAVTAAAHAIELFPDYVDEGSAYIVKARAHKELGEADAVTATLQEYRKLGGHDPAALIALAKSLGESGKNDDAIAVLEDVLMVAPLRAEVHSELGDRLLEAGDAKRAVVEYSALLAMNPHDLSDAHYRLAKAYFAAEDRPRSREHLLYALEIAPGFREAQQLLLEIVR
jgi:tetratricopeptide (TPR) repeat protein